MIKNFVTQAEMEAAVNAAIAASKKVVIQLLGDPEPADEYGGTWELVSQGRMLIGASDDYPLGSTGGAIDHSHVLSKNTFAALFINGNMMDYLYFVGESSNPYTYESDYQNTIPGGVSSGAAVARARGIQVLGDTTVAQVLPPYLAVNIWHKISD